MPSLLLCCIRILLLSVGQLVYIHPNKSDFLSVCVSLHFLRMCPGVRCSRGGVRSVKSALKCIKPSLFQENNRYSVYVIFIFQSANACGGKYALGDFL